MSKLRFTGRLPTEDAMRQFANWEFALEEEGDDDQDETTLRPGDAQASIEWETACTAAIATTPDGTELMAVLRGDGMTMHTSATGVDGIHVYRGDDTYDIECFPGAWRPEKDAPTALRFFDPEMVPLRIVSVLPTAGGEGQRHEITLMPDGVLLHGDAAARQFVYPDVFRPSDMVDGDRSHLAGRLTSTIYTLNKGKQQESGESERVIATEPGVVKVTVRSTQAGASLDIALLLDERSLGVRYATSTLNGTTRTFSLAESGNDQIPPNVFGDEETFLRCVPLAVGWRAMLPVLSSVSGDVRNCIVEVEAREAAPGHPASSAWRVRTESGNQVQQTLWIDATTRRTLALQVTVPGTDIQHTEIIDPVE